MRRSRIVNKPYFGDVKEPHMVDLVISPVHTVEVAVHYITPKGNFYVVYNPYRPAHESFRVHKDKIREIEK